MGQQGDRDDMLLTEFLQILKRPEFFGQYGKVVHMVVNKSQGYNR